MLLVLVWDALPATGFPAFFMGGFLLFTAGPGLALSFSVVAAVFGLARDVFSVARVFLIGEVLGEAGRPAFLMYAVAGLLVF